MRRKIRTVIDTDAGYALDDSFAISYALCYGDVLDVRAITLSPYTAPSRHIDIADSFIEAKNEVARVLRLMGIKNDGLIYEGTAGFFSEGFKEVSPAVKKIAELAKRGKVTVIALGALTNLAVALNCYPDIAPNLDIIWTGTTHLFHDYFDDVNYCRDRRAFDAVVRSKANLTIVPNYVGKSVVTCIPEVKASVAVNDIGRYLLRTLKADTLSPTNEAKTIYDLAPVAYAVDSEMFFTKTISASLVLKGNTKKPAASRTVNYVYDVKPGNIVMQDFVDKITKVKNNITPQQVFFISDTHFGDTRKFKVRQTPFKNTEEMDRELVRRWNSVVSEKDVVYHLGDFGKYRYVKELHGKIYLICGNHEKWVYGKDKDFDAFRQQLIRLGFADVYKDGVMLSKSVLGQEVYLNHYPSKTKRNCLNMFGHVHELKPMIKNGFNVAVNYIDYTPLSSKDAKRFLNFLKEQQQEHDEDADFGVKRN